MRKVIDWKMVAQKSKSHKYTKEMSTSILCLALECSYLTHLDFRNMSINEDESDLRTVALAQVLHHNFNLERLYLSNNNISDAGAVALAQALHHNSTLEKLHLYGNDAIGKEGTHQLVQALTVNTSITNTTSYHSYDGGAGLILPRRCKKHATQCTQYNTVKDRIFFF